MERNALTPDMAEQLRSEGYRSLIAKGSPEKQGERSVQVMIASKGPVHNEPEAEAAWQVSLEPEMIRELLDRGDTVVVVERS